MGNKLCRKRKVAKEAKYRGKVKNNLELYLNDVYEKECEFKIEDEEVEFIKTGIETLVQNVVDKLLEGTWADKLLGEMFGKLHDEDYLQKSVKEVYFPKSKDSYFQQYPHILSTRGSIIKVGSFYEGTRNGFPDEFDFIFALFSCTEETPFSFLKFLTISIKPYIEKTLEENKLSFCYPPTDAEPRYMHVRYPAKHNTTRRLYFEKYLQKSGPAHTLQFIYMNCEGQTRDIHVDLVPAEKIDVREKHTTYENVGNIKPNSFHKETLSAESFIKVFGEPIISLTLTEVHFMRHILSKKHVKVYRILKYLITGHGDGEKLKNYCMGNFRRSELIYSSYKIKTMIIYHHDECANSDTENIGPCVIQVLEEMSKYKDITHFPHLNGHTEYGGNYTKFCLFPYLQDLAKNLKTIQSSQYTYEYETHQKTPLSNQYLNDKKDGPADVFEEDDNFY